MKVLIRTFLSTFALFNLGCVTLLAEIPANFSKQLSIETISGKFTPNYNNLFVVDIQATGNDLLNVLGSANLNGTLQTSLLNGYRPPLGSTYTILEADSVSGRFNFLLTNITPTIVFEPIYTSDEVQLKVVRDYLNVHLMTALRPNDIAVGGMLNRVSRTATGDLNHVLNVIDSLKSYKKVAHAYEQLAPRTAAVQTTLAFSEATLQSRNLIRRMYLLRNGCNKIDFSGLCVESSEGCLSGNQCNDIPDACSEDEKWGFFATGKALFGNQRRTDHQDKFHSTTTGVTTGIDYELFDLLTAGIMGGYSYSIAHLDHNGGSLHVHEWQVGLYGTGYFKEVWYDFIGTYGWNNYNIERSIDFSSIDRHAKAHPDGQQYSLYGDLGRDFCFCDVILEPMVSLQYTHVKIDRYRERGAGSLSLIVGHQRAWSLQGSIGGTINYRFDLCSMTIMPSLRAFYVYEFHDKGRSIHARLHDAPHSYFDINSGAPGKEFGLLGAGIAALIKENMMVYLDYDAEVARENYFVQCINAGLRIAF